MRTPRPLSRIGVREGFDRGSGIVITDHLQWRPLNTMRAILKDARMRTGGGPFRRTLRSLQNRGTLELVVERVGKLNTHFGQARADLEGLGTCPPNAAGQTCARLE